MSCYFNVAMIQAGSVVPAPGMTVEETKQTNLGKMEFYVSHYALGNPNVDMVVFPELFLTGADPATCFQMSENLEGFLVQSVCDMAKKYNKWIVPGSIFEKINDSAFYNTALMISPEGELVFKHRKIYIPYPLEPSTPSSDPLQVYEIPGIGVFGMLICADGHDPLIARKLALLGAEVIIKPTFQNHMIGGPDNHKPVVQTRALENQCYVVSVNQPTPGCMGGSLAADPEGHVISELGESEHNTFVQIDLSKVRACRSKGSFGTFQFLKLSKYFAENGADTLLSYDNIVKAPVFDKDDIPVSLSPDQIIHW